MKYFEWPLVRKAISNELIINHNFKEIYRIHTFHKTAVACLCLSYDFVSICCAFFYLVMK